MKPSKEKITFIECLFGDDEKIALLMRKHLFSLTILLVSISFIFFIIYKINDLQAGDGKYINLSGKQRMLTERLAHLTIKSLIKSDKILEEEIQQTLNNIQTAQEEINKNSEQINVVLNQEIEKTLEKVEEKIKHIIENGKQSYALLESLEKEISKLVAVFDQTTYEKELLLQEKSEMLNWILMVVGVVVVLSILAQDFFVYRPAIIESINRNIKLNELNKTLNQKVEEEVAKRREQELMLSQKMKAAEMGELINNIAHQWRQPITIISCYMDLIEMLLETDPINKEEVLENLNKSKKTLMFMSDTIDDFRTFFLPSKIDKRFNIIKSIEKIEKLLHNHITYHNIIISIETEKKEEYTVFGRQGELEQCFMILLNNAKDAIVESNNKTANTAGIISIFVFTEGEYIVCQIQDNGGGIPESVKKNIFKPYFTTKKDNGTGVGLYMCKNIIETKFNGTLSFETDGATSTTFCLKLKKESEHKRNQ